MSAFVLLSLPLCLLLVASLMGLALFDFTARTPSFAGDARRRNFRPAVTVLPTTELLQTTASLACEISEDETRLTCSETGFVPQVTRVEASAIAHEIRRQGADEIHRVLQQSRLREERCPMRLEDGQCACTCVRPLDCLGRCVIASDAPEWANGLGVSISTAFRQHLKRHQADATTQRLDDALLDALGETAYLNSTVA